MSSSISERGRVYLELEARKNALSKKRDILKKKTDSKAVHQARFREVHASAHEKLIVSLETEKLQSLKRNKSLIGQTEDLESQIQHRLTNERSWMSLHSAVSSYQSRLHIALPAHLKALQIREEMVESIRPKLESLEKKREQERHAAREVDKQLKAIREQRMQSVNITGQGEEPETNTNNGTKGGFGLVQKSDSRKSDASNNSPVTGTGSGRKKSSTAPGSRSTSPSTRTRSKKPSGAEKDGNTSNRSNTNNTNTNTFFDYSDSSDGGGSGSGSANESTNSTASVPLSTGSNGSRGSGRNFPSRGSSRTNTSNTSNTSANSNKSNVSNSSLAESLGDMLASANKTNVNLTGVSESMNLSTSAEISQSQSQLSRSASPGGSSNVSINSSSIADRRDLSNNITAIRTDLDEDEQEPVLLDATLESSLYFTGESPLASSLRGKQQTPKNGTGDLSVSVSALSYGQKSPTQTSNSNSKANQLKMQSLEDEEFMVHRLGNPSPSAAFVGGNKRSGPFAPSPRSVTKAATAKEFNVSVNVSKSFDLSNFADEYDELDDDEDIVDAPTIVDLDRS